MDRRHDHAQAAAIPWWDDRRLLDRESKRLLIRTASALLTHGWPAPEVHDKRAPARYSAERRKTPCKLDPSQERRVGERRR